MERDIHFYFILLVRGSSCNRLYYEEWVILFEESSRKRLKRYKKRARERERYRGKTKRLRKRQSAANLRENLLSLMMREEDSESGMGGVPD